MLEQINNDLKNAMKSGDKFTLSVLRMLKSALQLESISLKKELEEENGYGLSELSMGMSNDYKIAVHNGSTMIRVGRKLFL